MKDDFLAGHWPESGLEALGACPVCGAKQRHLLHEGLTDDAFRCAPGKWTLWRCSACTNAYLDPRPDVETIGMAYRAYYTHADDGAREDFRRLGRLRKLRRVMSNSYTNHRYGTAYLPSSSWMGLLLRWLPLFRQGLDVPHRWLPKPGVGNRLLDVGCGNGAFLATARECGWEAYGVDPDPEAVASARSRGADVRIGDVSAFADMPGQFSAITLSHSIEHVHDPVQVLRAAHDLLAPGGVIYVDTPNIDSRGHQVFGRHWRGLETPRHLVLFNSRGLVDVLERVGFDVEARLRRTSVVAGMCWASHLISRGRSPYDDPSRAAKLKARLWAGISFLMPASRLEFITLIARRKAQ